MCLNREMVADCLVRGDNIIRHWLKTLKILFHRSFIGQGIWKKPFFFLDKKRNNFVDNYIFLYFMPSLTGFGHTNMI